MARKRAMNRLEAPRNEPERPRNGHQSHTKRHRSDTKPTRAERNSACFLGRDPKPEWPGRRRASRHWTRNEPERPRCETNPEIRADPSGFGRTKRTRPIKGERAPRPARRYQTSPSATRHAGVRSPAGRDAKRTRAVKGIGGCGTARRCKTNPRSACSGDGKRTRARCARPARGRGLSPWLALSEGSPR
jgi:hypothetical protein